MSELSLSLHWKNVFLVVPPSSELSIPSCGSAQIQFVNRCHSSHPPATVQGHAWWRGQGHLWLSWWHRRRRRVPCRWETYTWRGYVARRHAWWWWRRITTVARWWIRWGQARRWIGGGGRGRAWRWCCRGWIDVGVIRRYWWCVAGWNGCIGGTFRLHHGLQALEAFSRHVGAGGGHDIVGRWRRWRAMGQGRGLLMRRRGMGWRRSRFTSRFSFCGRGRSWSFTF